MSSDLSVVHRGFVFRLLDKRAGAGHGAALCRWPGGQVGASVYNALCAPDEAIALFSVTGKVL